jgi:hypothetical protein
MAVDDASDGDQDGQDAGTEDRGKGIMDVREKITVRARLSENGRDVQVTVFKSDHLKTVSKKILEKSKLPSNKKIRMAYMGKMLKDNATLEAQGWQVGHILNALVFDTQ